MNAKEIEFKSQSENTDSTKTAEGVYHHQFNKPFVYEGKTYESMDFHFEALVGSDMVKIETEMQQKGDFVVAAEISRGFQAHIAARAAGIGCDVIEAMPMNEFNRITNEARSFLLNTGY